MWATMPLALHPVTESLLHGVIAPAQDEPRPSSSTRSRCRRVLHRNGGSLPKFFRGWAESAFCCDDADRKWLRLRSEMQELYSVSETVTKVYRNGDAAPRFDGRHDAGHAVMFLDDARFLFHLRKGDRE